MIAKTNRYNTLIFKEIYPTLDDFTHDYTNSGFPDNVSHQSLSITFYLLLGRYGNNPIANRDINQWRTKLFGIIFQYAPAWEKRLDIQEKIRKFTEADILKSTKTINNRAYNPDTAPGTASLEELAFINDQSTNTVIRSKLDGYSILWDLIEADVSEEYINRFKKLFKIFVNAENVVLYGEEEDIEEFLDMSDDMRYI